MKLTYVHKMALSWSPDSKSFITSSADCTTMLCTHLSTSAFTCMARFDSQPQGMWKLESVPMFGLWELVLSISKSVIPGQVLRISLACPWVGTLMCSTDGLESNPVGSSRCASMVHV